MRNGLADLFLAIVRKNIDGIVDALLAIGTIPANIDRIRLKKDLGYVYEKYSALPLKEIHLGEV